MGDPGVQDMAVREEQGMGVLGSTGEEESGAPGTEDLGGTWMRGSWEHPGSGNGGGGKTWLQKSRSAGHGGTGSTGI